MSWQQIVYPFVGLAQALTLFLLAKVKRDTAQVNNAVNHVKVGHPTLTQRVDVITDDLELLKARRLATDSETKTKFDLVFEKQDNLRGKIESIRDTQKQTIDELKKVREAIDRRKETNE